MTKPLPAITANTLVLNVNDDLGGLKLHHLDPVLGWGRR
jgi:hypothetical protein